MKLKFLFSILILTTLIFSYSITTFSDSITSIEYNFTGASANDSYYVSVPLNINVSSAILNVNGSEYWESSAVTQITDDSDEQDYPVIAIDSNSNVHIFWHDGRTGGYSIYYANSTFGPWTNQLLVENSTDTDETLPDVVIDSNDVWHLTWLRYVSSGAVVMYMNSSSLTEVNVSEVADIELQPAIAVAPNNSIHIAWPEVVSTNYDIIYASSMDNFVKDIQISNSSRDDVTPDIGVDSNGVVHLIWQDPVRNDLEGTGKQKLLLAQACPIYSYLLYANSSNNFVAGTIVRGHVTSYYCNLREPNIGFFSNNSPVFAFHENGAIFRVRKAYVNTFDNYVSNGYDERITVADFIDGNNIQLAIDLNDLVHVAFSNNSGTYYSNSQSFSESFSLRHLLTSSASNWQSIAAGPSGRAFVAWSDLSSGNQDIYFNFYGYVPTNPLIDLGTENAFSYSGEYNGKNETNISTALENYLPLCANITDGNCLVTINTSSDSKGILNVENISIVYGTQLTGVSTGLSFNLSNGTSVSSNAIFEDSDVYVYNGSQLISKVPISFSSQPDYTGWSSSFGVTSNNLAYVLTDPLSSAVAPQNTSQKTIYLELVNTGTSLVCLIDNSLITSAVLDGITKGSHCTANGGTILSPSTITAGGKTYFAIPNVENSGAVQIIREESMIVFGGGGSFRVSNPPSTPESNNPPIIANARITPSSGFVYSLFTFRAEIFDPDNDEFEFARVYIDGVPYEMTSNDFSSPAEGREYIYETYLDFSNEHEYYFEAGDGKDIGLTVLQIGPVMYPVEDVPIPVISSASGLTIVFVIVIFLFAVILFAKRKFS